MKKFLTIFLAIFMLLTVVACGSREKENTETSIGNGAESTDQKPQGPNGEHPSETEKKDNESNASSSLPYENAAALLNLVWNTLPEASKFTAMGGDYDHLVEEKAGKFHLNGNNAATGLNAMTQYPVADFAKLQDAATLIHGMLANHFACGAYRFQDAETAANMVAVLKAEIMNNEWMCGFPEKLSIITVPGNYVIVMYGLGEGCVDVFTAQALETLTGAALAVNVSLGGK